MASTEDKSRDELPPGFSGRLKMYSMLIGSVRTPVANAHMASLSPLLRRARPHPPRWLTAAVLWPAPVGDGVQGTAFCVSACLGHLAAAPILLRAAAAAEPPPLPPVRRINTMVPFVVQDLGLPRSVTPSLLAAFHPGYISTQIPSSFIVKSRGPKFVCSIQLLGSAGMMMLVPAASNLRGNRTTRTTTHRARCFSRTACGGTTHSCAHAMGGWVCVVRRLASFEGRSDVRPHVPDGDVSGTNVASRLPAQPQLDAARRRRGRRRASVGAALCLVEPQHLPLARGALHAADCRALRLARGVLYLLGGGRSIPDTLEAARCQQASCGTRSCIALHLCLLRCCAHTPEHRVTICDLPPLATSTTTARFDREKTPLDMNLHSSFCRWRHPLRSPSF
jgi:hypothetical protein